MSGNTESTKAQTALQSLRRSIETGDVELVIEPRLLGNPQERLSWFKDLPPDEIARCGANNVEYYLRSSKPLAEYEGSDVLARDTYSTANQAGQSVYYYRLSGKYIPTVETGRTPGKGNNPYFDITNLDFRKFTPSEDPFFLIRDKDKTKIGLGVVRTGKDYTLVMRAAQNPEKQLQDAGLSLEHHDFIYYNPNDKSWIAVISQLPPSLADSIRLAHNLPEPAHYKNIDHLLNRCRRDADLFAPVSITVPAKAAQPVTPPVSATPDNIPAETLLPEALQAYNATIEGRRRGDGSVQYTLIMHKDSSALATEAAEWKKRFAKPQDVVAYLAKVAGFAPPRPQTGDVQRFRIEPNGDAEACIAALARAIRTPVDAITIRPFALQTANKIKDTPNHFRFADSGIVRLHVLKEDGGAYLVAVADETERNRKKLISDIKGLGVKVADGKIETHALLTKEERAERKRATAYYAKIPIAPIVYQDLQADGIPALPPSDDLVHSIRIDSDRVSPTTAPAAQAVAVAPYQSTPQAASAPESEKRIAARDAKLAELLLGIRSETSELYIGFAKKGETTQPYAYIIVNQKHYKSIRNRLGVINEDFKALNAPVTPASLAISGEGTRQVRNVVAIPLTEGSFAALNHNDAMRREANHGYESIQLSLSMGHSNTGDFDAQRPIDMAAAAKWLKQRADEMVAEASAPKPFSDSAHTHLTAMLEPLARHTRGGIIKVKLPDADSLKRRIAILKADLTTWQAADHTPPLTAETLDAHAFAAGRALADPSHLKGESGTIKQRNSASQRVEEKFKLEIARLERTLKIVETYGQELPAIVIRGPIARLKAEGWKKLQEAVAKPGGTVEGEQDIEAGRIEGLYNTETGRIEGVYGMGKNASAVLRVHEVSLPAGRKNERKAAVIIITPALAGRIEEQLALNQRVARSIGEETPVDDGSVNDVVIHHYAPTTPLPEKTPRLKEAFAKLGHRAIRVKQRADSGGIRVASGDRGAQEALYITVDAGNQADAVNMLLALHENNALAGEKRYTRIGQSEALPAQAMQEQLATLKHVRDASRFAYNMLFDPTSFGHAHKILETIQSNPAKILSEADRAEMRFQSTQIADALSSPYSLLTGVCSATEESLFERIVASPIAHALQEAGKEDVLSLLKDLCGAQHIHYTDPRIAAYAKLLRALPRNVDALFEPDMAALNRPGEIAAIAAAEYAPTAFTLTDAEGSKPLVIHDDPRIARRMLREALASAGKDKPPVILHCILTPEATKEIEAAAPSRTRYSQLLRDSLREDEALPLVKIWAARQLDGLSDGRAHTQKEILDALKGFYGIGEPVRSRRGR